MALTGLTALAPLTPVDRLSQATPQGSASPAGVFDQLLDNYLGGPSRAEAKANEAISALAAGEVDDVHSVTLAVAQADLSFRLALEIRNRLLDAYQEIIRLQV